MTLSDLTYSPPPIVAIEAELDQLGLGHRWASVATPIERRPPPGVSSDLAAWIEHTLLKPTATLAEIARLCAEARQHGFLGVCVNPIYVSEARELLVGSDVRVVSVIGFPLGATCSAIKAREAELAVLEGADEIDMVLALGAMKDRRYRAAYEDIAQVVSAAAPAPVKVIIETALLTDREKIAASLIALRAGAAFVKTSTGFASGGATVDDVRLIRATIGDGAGIKAAGGIKTAAFARALVEAGATRLGCSASVAIVSDPD